MGADCSGVTGAILQNVAVPNGMVMISPSATSPGLSTVEDNGLFFRTAPSDARQGEVMAEILQDRGVNRVAVTYTNNDYGKGLADAFQRLSKQPAATSPSSPRMKTARRTIRPKSARWPRPAVKRWSSRAMSTRAVGHHRAALDAGAFDTFDLPDGMVGDTLKTTSGRTRRLLSARSRAPTAKAPTSSRDGRSAGFDGTCAFARKAMTRRR